MKKNFPQINELILDSEVSYLITISKDGDATANIITDNPEIDTEQIICDALFDVWLQEGVQPEEMPSPIGRFVFETDPDPEPEPCMCPECQEMAKQEALLAQKN